MNVNTGTCVVFLSSEASAGQKWEQDSISLHEPSDARQKILTEKGHREKQPPGLRVRAP